MKFHNGIPGWFNFPDFYDWVVMDAPEKAYFVEVGALFGASAVYMNDRIALSGKKIRFDVVDNFSLDNLSMAAIEITMPFGDFRPTFDFYTKDRFSENVQVRQMLSLDHAASCKDSSLDFVFLDGSHSKLDVLREISAYLAKMRAGGILGGHDVDAPGVADAVHDTFGDKYHRFGKSCWYVRV